MCRAQTQTTSQGNIIVGDTNGKLFPTAPFSCYVDGVINGGNLNIAACINLLGSRQGGVITSKYAGAHYDASLGPDDLQRNSAVGKRQRLQSLQHDFG